MLSVATLEPRKNLAHLIRSFTEVVQAQKVPDLCLVLAGSRGWNLAPILVEAGRQRGLRERIIVTGFVQDEDLAPLYSGATMFVYPSLYEGFGLPALEAMQCGVPVITSNISSLPEVVGDAGVMVDPRDGDALCQTLLDLYRSSARREVLARRGRERASQFSWERCVRETLEAYRKALA